MLQETPPQAPPPARGRRFLPSRRAFLIGTGAALGLGVAFALWPREWPNARAGVEGETLLNAWIAVAPDGTVRVAVPQAEMGQGVFSGFAQIVADELGADWRMVAVEPAPWHPAFAHVGLVTASTGGLPPMLKGLADRMGATVIRRLNLHLTGGSTSIRGYHDSLREAAAAARGLLVAAAARHWGVDRAAVDAREGQLVHQSSRMGFAEAVRLVDPDRDSAPVALRPVERRPFEGKPLPRIDIPSKVDGSARFGGDVRLPGMVFAAIRHGPVDGRLVRATAPAGVPLVRGDNWVATVGVTTHAARRRLAEIEASFAAVGQPAGEWIDAALAEALAGPPPAAPADGRRVVADYSVPFLAHAAMEPMVAAARVADGRVEVWGPTQSLTLAYWALSRALGVEQSAITVYPTLVGGGFGRKAEADAMVEAALIARAVERPVLLQWSREEDLGADAWRPPAAARMEAVLDAGGAIADWSARIATPSLAASFGRRHMPRLAPAADRASDQAIEGAEAIPYRTAAFRAEHVPVLQPVPLGYWRSVGHSFTAFFVESFIDELAAEAGQDPLDFRLRLLDGRPQHQRVLRAAADAGQWGEELPAGIGRGVALHPSFGSIVATVVEAGLVEGAIRIRRVASAIDCGRAINPDSVRAQVEGGTLMGLSAALGEAATFADGFAAERNFHAYPLLTMAQSPDLFTTVIVAGGGPLGGVGEPATPPAAPALANALFAATGIRARALPLGAQFAG